MRTSEQRILITGGGSGIGLALAKRLAPTNTVVIAGRDEAKLERAKAETPSLQTVRLDVISEEDASHAITRLREQIGGLDVLVNNAGVMYGYGLADMEARARSEEEAQTNLLGSLRMTRLALPLLQDAQDAAVVFFSSALALAPAPGLAVYSATKTAVHSLARSIRHELAPESIKMFEVLPPLVDTPMTHGLHVPKIDPETVAKAIIRGLSSDRYEARVGEVRGLAVVAKLAPRGRFEYALSDKGRDLAATVLTLMEWGDRYYLAPGGPPRLSQHRDCGDSVEVEMSCTPHGSGLTARDLILLPGPGAPARSERVAVQGRAS